MRNTNSLVLSLICLFFLAGVSGFSQDVCTNNDVHCIERPVCWGSKPFADYAQIDRGDVLVLDIKKTCCDRVKGEVDDPGGIGWQGGGSSKSVRFLTHVPQDKSGSHIGKMSGIMLGCGGNDEKSKSSRTEWKAKAFAEVCNKDICKVYADECNDGSDFACLALDICKSTGCTEYLNCVRKCLAVAWGSCQDTFGKDSSLTIACHELAHAPCFNGCAHAQEEATQPPY